MNSRQPVHEGPQAGAPPPPTRSHLARSRELGGTPQVALSACGRGALVAVNSFAKERLQSCHGSGSHPFYGQVPPSRNVKRKRVTQRGAAEGAIETKWFIRQVRSSL